MPSHVTVALVECSGRVGCTPNFVHWLLVQAAILLLSWLLVQTVVILLRGRPQASSARVMMASRREPECVIHHLARGRSVPTTQYPGASASIMC